jgi:soluble lytic murein transglycosylase-like protein
MSGPTRACIALLCAAALLAPCAKGWAQGDDSNACDRAARDAEGEFSLPPGVLLAIGSVESGRWPWTANVDGAAETYRSKAEAIAALTRVRSPRPADVDVGCFQISLHYHPFAFATISEALDPPANARYAARFLRELRDRYGDWDRAVGAYHSATGVLEASYRDRVIAQWKGAPAEQPPAVATSDQPRWRVISIAAALPPNTGSSRLPRIITLGN